MWKDKAQAGYSGVHFFSTLYDKGPGDKNSRTPDLQKTTFVVDDVIYMWHSGCWKRVHASRVSYTCDILGAGSVSIIRECSCIEGFLYVWHPGFWKRVHASKLSYTRDILGAGSEFTHRSRVSYTCDALGSESVSMRRGCHQCDILGAWS